MNCPDCPDLAGSADEPARMRAKCCRDEHIDQRRAGSIEPWKGTDADRGVAPESRQVRRWKKRKGREASQ